MGISRPTWDPWTMFDASKRDIELANKRKQMRLENLEKFKRMRMNPHSGGEGGHIFDPAVQRWYSARMTGSDFFRVTSKSVNVLMWGYLIPSGIFFYLIHKDRAKREEKCRRGEIPASERNTIVY